MLTTKDYLRSILAIIVFFLMLIIATPLILFLLVITLGRASNFVVEFIASIIVRPVFWVSGISFEIKLHTESITAPAVFIINHTSTLDVLTILALGLPKIRYVAKWEFQYNPLFFLLGRLTGQIFIQRKKSEEAIARLQNTYNRIRQNELSVIMAPEGSRSHPGVIGPFKKGPFYMAMDLDYPIVPIYFEGNRELSKGNSMLTKAGKLTTHIHEPIDVSEWTEENLEKQIIQVRQRYLEWAGVEDDIVDPIA